MGEFSYDEAEELLLCSNDFTYFCEKYVLIKNPKLGNIPFELFEYQKRLIETIEKERFVIGKKFRQGGFSSIMCAWNLWKCMFKIDLCYGILNVNERQSMCCQEIVENMIDNLPDWLKPNELKITRGLISFKDTGSKLYLISASHNYYSRTLDNLYIDEAAFIPEMEKQWKGIYPNVAAGAKCQILSTPNKTDNWFYKTYLNAQVGDNKFKIFQCSYDEHPQFKNINWQKDMHGQLGDNGFCEEVKAEFLVPGKKYKIFFDEFVDEPIKFVSTLEEEFEFLSSHDPRWKKEDIEREKAIESLENFNDHAEVDKEECKPEVHQWDQLDKESIHNIFEEEHKYVNVIETDHPKFDETSYPKSIEEVSEFWSDFAELNPEWVEIAEIYECEKNEKIAKDEEHEEILIRHIEEYGPEVFALAGVMDSKEVKEISEQIENKSFVPARIEILDKVINEIEFSKDLKLDLYNKYLSVNGAPTKITEQSVKWSYMGLSALIGHEKAVEQISQIIKDKLQSLF